MTPGARRGWGAVALGALPVAWLLAGQGHGMVVREPLRDLLWLLVLALAEEVIFRGGLQTGLLRSPALAARRFGLSGANLLTSVVFSAAHLWAHTPLQALGVFPVSLLLGASLEQSGRLWLPAALHVWFNLALYLSSWVQRAA